MIRLRILGRKEEIDWIVKLLEDNEDIRTIQKSDKMRLRRSNRFFRAYMQIEKKWKGKSK